MAGAAIGHLPFAEQPRVFQRRGAVQEIAHGDLQLIAQQHFLQLARPAHQHRQAHGLVALAKALYGPPHQRVVFRGCIADQADGQAADQLPVHVARLRAESFQALQRSAGQVDEAPALGRQAKAAAPALAQAEPQACLQRGQLAAERGLPHAKNGLRSRYTARVDDGQKHAQQPQVEI
ncbi:hypothetical protein GY15_08255 [Delftia sp. 670]|nr:hypothetical protein GY15_08255 [Delftia sp. 670]